MNDRNRSENDSHLGNPKRFADFLKEWKEVMLSAIGAITAIATALGFDPHGPALWIGLVVAGILLAGGGFFYHRTRRKHELQQKRNETRATFKAKKQQRMAFRGLYPYQEGDTLPGAQRQREALTISTAITDPDFSFGVVCGDSGCGKTSLLRSVLQTHLKEHGHRVLYVSSPRQFVPKLTSTEGNEEINRSTKLNTELKSLARIIASAGQDLPLVVIIDQFEEFFIEYRGELRSVIGSFLNEKIHAKPGTRFLCAVRRDYLVDMRDLAPQLPEPISVKTLFVIKNLTVEQATDIIRECAEMDGIELEDGFGNTLAAELADGGEVRPPELQIVCTALVGNLTLEEYRLAGGARGILSHYIQNAIAICGDPKIGGQLLRALCDFPAHAKRNPQTLEILCKLITPPGGLKEQQLLGLIGSILSQFESDRLVLIDVRGEPTYTLIHDYLVDAVATATTDLSTRTEEANQLLQYYLSQSRSDDKITIPFRRARFIKKFADSTATRELHASRLLRRSRNTYIRNTAAIGIFVVLLTAVLLAVLNIRNVWESQEIGRHFGPTETGSTSLGVSRDGNRVVTWTASTQSPHLWEAKTGKLLISYTGKTVMSDSEKFILIQVDGDRLTAVYLPSNQVVETPISIKSNVYFSRAGTTIAYTEDSNSQQKERTRKQTNDVMKIWSIPEKRELGQITGFATGLHYDVTLMNAADRIVMYAQRDQRVVPALWNVPKGELMTYLAPNAKSSDSYGLDEERNRIVTTHVLERSRLLVQLWDARTGKNYLQRELPLEEQLSDVEPSFSKDGEFLILSKSFFDGGGVFRVLNTSDLLSTTDPPPLVSRFTWRQGSEEDYLYWQGAEGTYVWRVAKNSEPVLFRDLRGNQQTKTANNNNAPLINRVGDRLVAVEISKVQLFDFINQTKVKDLLPPRTIKTFQITVEGSAIVLVLEGGIVELYSLSDGNHIAELNNVGGTDDLRAFYDADCQRVHIWTNEGRVLRYLKGRRVLGRFWPDSRCE